jgi:hypothetical protein
MSEEIKAVISSQIKEYKSFEHIIRLGDYYCLSHPAFSDYSAYYYASGDEILLTVIEKAGCKAGQTRKLRIRAADPFRTYTDVRTGKNYSGEELRSGIKIDLSGEADSAKLCYFKAN